MTIAPVLGTFCLMQVKGNAFTTGLKVWKEVLTADEWKEVHAGLPPATRDMIVKPPLAMSWIDADATNAIGRRVHELFGQRGLEICERVGALVLEHDLRTIYKMLMRVVSVDFAVSRASQMYSTYVKDAGTLDAQRTGPQAMVAHYRNLTDFNDSNQWFLAGSVLGVLRLAGAKDVHVTKRVRTETGFEFHYGWGA